MKNRLQKLITQAAILSWESEGSLIFNIVVKVSSHFCHFTFCAQEQVDMNSFREDVRAAKLKFGLCGSVRLLGKSVGIWASRVDLFAWTESCYLYWDLVGVQGTPPIQGFK